MEPTTEIEKKKRGRPKKRIEGSIDIENPQTFKESGEMPIDRLKAVHRKLTFKRGPYDISPPDKNMRESVCDRLERTGYPYEDANKPAKVMPKTEPVKELPRWFTYQPTESDRVERYLYYEVMDLARKYPEQKEIYHALAMYMEETAFAIGMLNGATNDLMDINCKQDRLTTGLRLQKSSDKLLEAFVRLRKAVEKAKKE